MNERIKLLAQQVEAGYIPRYDMWQMDTETLEKFTELIVRECAKISYAGIGADQLDEYDRGWQNGRNLASELVKQHFGVKE